MKHQLNYTEKRVPRTRASVYTVQDTQSEKFQVMSQDEFDAFSLILEYFDLPVELNKLG